MFKELHPNSFLVEKGFNHILVVLEAFKSVLSMFELRFGGGYKFTLVFKPEVRRSLFPVSLPSVILLSC